MIDDLLVAQLLDVAEDDASPEVGGEFVNRGLHLLAQLLPLHLALRRVAGGAQVQSAIDKLPPDLRTCVILRDIEELSYQEIVDHLKIPEGTVKSRINRGRIELAKILRRMRVVAMSDV